MRTIRRRRLERKTDYKARLALIKSGKDRLVIRKTNRYVVAQIVSTDIAKDKVVTGMSTKDLLKEGWPKESKGSLKSRSACYLLGFMIGKKALENKNEDLILDIGMHRNIHKSRIYAVVKGVIDSGLEIKCGENALPKIEEVKNEKFSAIVEKITGAK